MCSRLKPMEVVCVLNSMYVAYDKLCEKHLVYKVRKWKERGREEGRGKGRERGREMEGGREEGREGGAEGREG